MKRGSLLLSAVCGAAVMSLGLVVTPAHADSTKIKVQLAWLPDVSEAGEFVALEKGFFAKRGLSVDFMPGGPAANPIQELLGGSADIALAYAPQIMYAANRHLPIKSFAATYQKAPLAFYSLGEENIKSVKDWAGKRIGALPSATPQIKVLLAKAGLKFSDVTQIQAEAPALLQKQADVVAAWTTNVASIQPILDNPGGWNAQTIWDNGLQFQSNYYIATSQSLNTKLDSLRKYIEALDEGWAYAADHPKEAVKLVMKVAPGLNPEEELKSLKLIVADYVYTDETKTQGFANVSEDRWQKTLNTYAGIGEISSSLKATDVLDRRVLDSTKRTKR